MSAAGAVSADWVLPVDGPPLRNGRVAWRDGLIVEVAEGRAERHHEGAVILPGLVNAHSHLEYAVYGGFGDGLPFARWILVHIERKARIALEEMEAIARAGAAECLASGVTTVGDCSFSGASAAACDALGLRAVVYLEVFSARGLAPFEETRELVAASLSDRVRLGISPHAPYTCGLDLYAASLDLGLPVATHLNESRDELEWLTGGTGPWEAFAGALPPPLGETGVRALAAAGLLRNGLVAAHCVVVDDDELELLARHDVAVAHCPRSNAMLGCGIAPLRRLLDAGVRVGLGTDSPASAPSFDMFDELRAAVAMARAREERSDALSATDALELATLGGARALGLEEEIGTLSPGKRADLTVVSPAGSAYDPVEDPAVAAVFGGSPDRVLETIVDGETRYCRGESAWQEVRSTANAARGRMLA